MKSAIKTALLTAVCGFLMMTQAQAAEEKKEEKKESAASESMHERKDYVLVKYGNNALKKSEIEKEIATAMPGASEVDFGTLPPQLQENVVRNVISQKLIFEEAKKAGMENSDEVNARIDQLRKQVVMDAYIRRKAKEMVKDEEVKKLYEQKIATMKDKEEVRASHILLDNEKDAKAIIGRLKKGEGFDKLAKEKSKDPGSAQKGGDLDFFSPEQMVKPFADAAYKMKVGELSQAPVKTDFGYHIIKVTDRRKANPPSMEEMKPQLLGELQGKAVNSYLYETFDKAGVEILDADGKARKVASAPASAPMPQPK